MNKRLRKIRTVIWVIVGIVWFAIYKVVNYQIAMYYSNLAPQQLEDDSAYTIAKSQPIINEVVLWVFILFLAFIVWRIIKNLRLLFR